MKLILAAVGRPSRLLEQPIRDYMERAGRYWKLEVSEVRAERAGANRSVTEVRQAEAERLRAAVHPGAERIALTRTGDAWSSERLASYLNELAVRASPGAAFLIGGAFGLDRALLREATHRISLSPMTMPHDLARLVLAEQLYRAGTIIRGEPYHKG